MKIYTVHYPYEVGSSLTGLARETILVRDGFCWPALYVPFLWLIYKRMWIVLAIYVAAEIALTGLGNLAGLSDGLMLIGSLTLHVLMGFEGNNLYRWSLERRRFKQQAIVAGADMAAAEHRFFVTAEHRIYGSPVTAGAAV